MITGYALNDRVRMKKPHPCGCDVFVVIRTGADVKIKCERCGHVIMLDHDNFIKKAKRVMP